MLLAPLCAGFSYLVYCLRGTKPSYSRWFFINVSQPIRCYRGHSESAFLNYVKITFLVLKYETIVFIDRSI